MKKGLYLLSSFLFLASFSYAQTDSAHTTKVTTVTRTVTHGMRRLDSTTVVRDSAGTRLAYKDWHRMTTSGEYLLRTMSKPTDSAREYVLVKMDEAAKERFKTMQPGAPETGYIKTGAKVELFKAKDITGYKIDPTQLQGKVVVLNFWFINCAPCREEIPELSKIQADYANNTNIIFIGVALDEKDKLADFLKTVPFSYHIIEDGREIAAKYEIKGYPTNVIIGKDGTVKWHNTGYGPASLVDFKKKIDKEL